jgi:hypothetical protein
MRRYIFPLPPAAVQDLKPRFRNRQARSECKAAPAPLRLLMQGYSALKFSVAAISRPALEFFVATSGPEAKEAKACLHSVPAT